ncbi:MAG: ABC transporter ATP-binding protein [Oscillospiraceae bacterium]|nr:ABC transporter ATP-binding protein [Oscillospiraceae bacterium]
MALFTLQNVNYKDIIRYPDLEIAADGATFICGESGSGKSTLLKLLNGSISQTSGEITYGGKPLEAHDPIDLRRKALLVGQTAYLFDGSIRENFHKYYAYRDMKAPDDATIAHFLELCAVPLPLDSMCDVLSGGERQRIFIALCLSFGAEVLMLDEPTSALDDKNANTLMECVKSHCAAQRMGLIVVSHDKAIAAAYADHTIILRGEVAR